MSRQDRMKSLNEIIASHVEKSRPYRTSTAALHRARLAHLAGELARRSQGEEWNPFVLRIEECIYFVYLYLDSRYPGRYEYVLPSGRVVVFGHKPFYVGKGKRARMQDHLIEARKYNSRNHKVNTIRAIWKAGFEPIIEVTSSRSTDYISSALEIDLIAGIGRTASTSRTGPLTNLTDGGDGISGFRFSEESKVKMRVAKLGVKRAPFADSTRAKMSASMRGKPKSDSHKEKLRQANIGKKQSAETVAKRLAALSALPKLTCPHCGKTGQYMNMKGWHFDRCKHKEVR